MKTLFNRNTGIATFAAVVIVGLTGLTLDRGHEAALPKGIELKAVYDRTEIVDKALATSTNALIEGSILVAPVTGAALFAPVTRGGREMGNLRTTGAVSPQVVKKIAMDHDLLNALSGKLSERSLPKAERR